MPGPGLGSAGGRLGCVLSCARQAAAPQGCIGQPASRSHCAGSPSTPREQHRPLQCGSCADCVWRWLRVRVCRDVCMGEREGQQSNARSHCGQLTGQGPNTGQPVCARASEVMMRELRKAQVGVKALRIHPQKVPYLRDKRRCASPRQRAGGSWPSVTPPCHRAIEVGSPMCARIMKRMMNASLDREQVREFAMCANG